jgi:hypothetical protein
VRIGRHTPVVVVLIAVLVGAASAFAVPAPTGRASGIALARAVQRAYQHVRVQSYAEHGFVWMSAVEGKSSAFRWIYGAGPSPGLYPATEHAVLALNHGRLSWWRDDLTPAPCPTAGLCARVPVELVAEAGGLFYAFGGAKQHSCYAHLTGTTPVVVGKPVWFVGGDFKTPTRSGSDELLTSTYPWSKTQRATELDTIASGSHRLLKSHVEIAGPTGAAPFSYSASYGYPARVPPPPHINLCA